MQDAPKKNFVDMESKRISKASIMIDIAEMTKIESTQDTSSQQIDAALSLLHSYNLSISQAVGSTASPELQSFMTRIQAGISDTH